MDVDAPVNNYKVKMHYRDAYACCRDDDAAAAGNGCSCTMTFPQCTRRPSLTWSKAELS